MSITKPIKIIRKKGRYLESITKPPVVIIESIQGAVNKINILKIIANAPAPLLGKAFNIA